MVRIGAKQRNIFLGGKIPCSMKQGIANIGKAVFFRNHRPAAGFITPIFFRRLLLGLIKLVIIFPIKRFNFLCQGRPAFIAKRVIGKPRESAAAFEHSVNFGISNFLRHPMKGRSGVNKVVSPGIKENILKFSGDDRKIGIILKFILTYCAKMRAQFHCCQVASCL